MRQRIEDLGRIYVMIDNLLDLDIFHLNDDVRNKDFVEYFNELKDEQRDEIVHNCIYGLSNVKDKLYDIMSIAQGTDYLNETPE
jgi:hypothetical protein